jgi:hypothetical protein
MEIQGASHTLQTVAIASLFFAVLWFLPQISFQTQLRKLPAYVYAPSSKRRTTYLQSARKLYADGYKKVCTDLEHLSPLSTC